MKLNRIIGLSLLLLGLTSTANALPIDVSVSTTGTSGNYVLDFSVANNLTANNNVYFFGVELSAPGVSSSPSDFYSYGNWNNSPYGGSNTTYNNAWLSSSLSGIAPGSTLSGFKVHITDIVAPTQINWFAFAYGDNWTGGGNFHSSYNPGFEGVTGNGTSVPEPSALLLLGLGLLGLALSRRR